ncbi:MAG TPA: UDP-N-acetylmuramoyl-L-alanyl-D-glutamate--2,6-diaminopimelate ligase, partial [Acidimicrobiia bacterium]|nr:UDP-N-acetylmuramoyl-L-alanyl-D-glutamate--2,6-diaminopimelate ligase [Acidimicrobiia bacterium]
PLAAAVYDYPSRTMDIVGVTGTNGKTTVTHFVESMVERAGVRAGLIGTIATRVGGVSMPSVRTTPEASDLQRTLRRMRDLGTQVVAAEISSHALALHRIDATRFAVVAFTNLSQDHLDFHGDMDSYLAAKARLFEDFEAGVAVINIDDAAGRDLAERFQGDVLTVGRLGQVSWTDVSHAGSGTSFELSTPWGTRRVETPVLGLFNVENAVMASACCLALGLDFDAVVTGLTTLGPVPGRFELVSDDDPIRVIVDYAHTPAAVELAISSARELGGGRVIAVLGAGGDRDRSKRPLMGTALSAADLAIVTSDNPRSEDPQVVASEVAAGLRSGTEYVVDVDRRSAIFRAVAAANDGDMVLILGRGHEPSQEVAGAKIPFDDREVAREALEVRRGSTAFADDSGSMGP